MAGGRVSWLIILVVVVADLIAFGLAIGGERNRSKADTQEDSLITVGDYVYCKYSSDKASGFGAGAILFLLLGHVVVTGVTKCICCGGPYRAGSARVFGVIFFVVVWYVATTISVTANLGFSFLDQHALKLALSPSPGAWGSVICRVCFVLAELLLIVASASNSVRTKKGFLNGSDQISCKQLRSGIFNGGAAFSILTMFTSVVYYILITKAKDSGQDFRGGGIGMTQF